MTTRGIYNCHILYTPHEYTILNIIINRFVCENGAESFNNYSLSVVLVFETRSCDEKAIREWVKLQRGEEGSTAGEGIQTLKGQTSQHTNAELIARRFMACLSVYKQKPNRGVLLRTEKLYTATYIPRVPTYK